MKLLDELESKKFNSLKIVLFFAVLTMMVTAVVILAWEKFLMLPFNAWLAAHYAADGGAFYVISQRIEHFFISTTVDVLIVTLLLRIVSRQQRRLVASEKRYRELFEHAKNGIGVLKVEDLRLTDVNNKFCEILGCQPKGLVGKRIHELVSTSDEGSGSDPLAELLRAGPREDFEIELRAPAGNSIPTAVSTYEITADGERLVILIIRDLTAEREAAGRLRRMQERLAHHEKIAFLGRAAAQVAHEVKNPLAGLLLYAMHLRGKVADKLSENELSLIDKMVDTINNLTATANQVLDFARPIKLSPRPADLNRVMTDVLQLLRPQIEAGRIEPRMELDEACRQVVLDEPSIRSALMNLALNAVQAMPDGGTLNVRTEARDGVVNLEIRDEGAGMSKEQVDNIFEPFFTTKSQGLGLGMPFAQKVIEQHGGAVSIESSPGAGTTVRVTLPNKREVGADVTG